ncbi:MAG: dual specificity protein phosphatase family protein [bacterium]|nr:dual specificity protein phosphatase family protein [bacterium]
MRPREVIITILSFFILLCSGAAAQNATMSKELPNFHKVNDVLYRGGQPKAEGIAELKRLGIATVISLRSNDQLALQERARFESAGIRFLSLPLDNWKRPRVGEIDAILAQIETAANQPVFVHCKRGADRTGTVIAVYRMVHDGWDAKRAGDEAEELGIGWWQFGMRDFINDYYRDQIQKRSMK